MTENLLQEMILKGLTSKTKFSQEKCLTDLILSLREYPSKIAAHRAGVRIIEYCDICNEELKLSRSDEDDENEINSCEIITTEYIEMQNTVKTIGRKQLNDFFVMNVWCDQDMFVCTNCFCYYLICDECGDKMQLIKTMISREDEPDLIQYSHDNGSDNEDCPYYDKGDDCPCTFHDVSEEHIHYFDTRKFNCPFGPDGGFHSEWYCKKCDKTEQTTDK